MTVGLPLAKYSGAKTVITTYFVPNKNVRELHVSDFAAVNE